MSMFFNCLTNQNRVWNFNRHAAAALVSSVTLYVWLAGDRHRPDVPCIGEFFKKLLLSGIIYGIPDIRLRIDIDGLMHLRNNQLDKIVIPKDL
jgi:hypothetical protein